jgi:hypothetical protein
MRIGMAIGMGMRMGMRMGIRDLDEGLGIWMSDEG